MPSFWIARVLHAARGRPGCVCADRASAIVSGVGHVGVLQHGLNGTGVCGGVTIRGAALRSPNASCATVRDDVGGEPAARVGLVDDDEPAGVLDALEDRVHVERRRRARVDDLARDALAGELVGRLLGELHHAPERDDRHVVALAHDVGLAERDRVRLLGHVALERVEHLVLEEDHRVVVADRLDQQALGVVGVRRHDDLQPRDVGEDRVQRLRVLRRRADARRRTSCGSPSASPPCRRTCSGTSRPG